MQVFFVFRFFWKRTTFKGARSFWLGANPSLAFSLETALPPASFSCSQAMTQTFLICLPKSNTVAFLSLRRAIPQDTSTFKRLGSCARQLSARMGWLQWQLQKTSKKERENTRLPRREEGSTRWFGTQLVFKALGWEESTQRLIRKSKKGQKKMVFNHSGWWMIP